ncbi:MAG: FdtA/QdtA family cupin domain-containing protein [Patescibacteria group bacterium]|jgi:mannose-6-phosphate isomerase-like protein (cupin superfamily)
MECKIFQFKSFNDRGYNLTPVELKDSVPFEVKRLYFMDLGSGAATNQHSHKLEEEVFIQVKGSSTIVIDKGNGKEEIKLSGAGSAIYVPAYVWHGFKAGSSDCIILALSSTNYSSDRTDYLEDYDEYLKIRKAILKV